MQTAYLLPAYASAMSDPRSPRRRALRAYRVMRRLVRRFYGGERFSTGGRSARWIVSDWDSTEERRITRLAKYRTAMMAKHGAILAESTPAESPKAAPIVVFSAVAMVPNVEPIAQAPFVASSYVVSCIPCGSPTIVETTQTPAPSSGFSEKAAIVPSKRKRALVKAPMLPESIDAKRDRVDSYLRSLDTRPTILATSKACHCSQGFAKKRIGIVFGEDAAEAQPIVETPSSGFSEPATVEIKGEPYHVIADDSDPSRVFVSRVRRPSDDPYCIDGSWLPGCLVDGPHAGLSCECPDFTYRHSGTASLGCCHIKGLDAADRLPARALVKASMLTDAPSSEFSEPIDWAFLAELTLAGCC